MKKRLVITEKPSVARDIVAALGGFTEEDGFWERDDFVVTFAVGHLLELLAPEDLDDKYKRWTLDTLPIIPDKFQLKPKAGQKDRLKTIKALLERDEVASLVNACDAGREGELIFREIVDYNQSTKPIERLWLQSMTKTAIIGGFADLRKGEAYNGLRDAAYCRTYSDWLIGMNATRALTRRLKSRTENQAWSAGRVQTPTLAMLTDREMEVLGHTPVPYWRIRGTFAAGDRIYEGVWFDPTFKSGDGEEADQKDNRIFDQAKAEVILQKISGRPATAAETRKPSKEAAPPLFDLTSLQREGNRRFGWSARRTLNAAQRCYEAHKVLTYPRTDARALPSDYRPVVDEVIRSLGVDPRFASAAGYLERSGRQNEGKIFDDSGVSDHFAIIPTGVLPSRALEGDDGRLFDLVTRRFLAAFHPPAVWSRVERTTTVDGEPFRSRAKTLQVPGWRAVQGEEENTADLLLAPLIEGKNEAEGVPVEGKNFAIEADETRPAPRITEARLLSLMENAGRYVAEEGAAEALKDKGIGTPATRADIIENLIRKGYVVRAGKALRPSVKGIRLIDILHRMQAERLASPELTGAMEQHLSEVEHNLRKSETFMDEIREYTRDIVDRTKTFEFEILFPDVDPLGNCPLCQKPVYERSWFYRCKEPEGLALARKQQKKAKKGKKKAASPAEEGPAGSTPLVAEFVDCPFRIWKDKSGRYIDRTTVKELLASNQTRILDGFSTRQGRTYRGQLALQNGEISLRGVAGGEEDASTDQVPEYDVDDRPLGSCPHCNEGQVVETRKSFICSRGLEVLKSLQRDEASLFPLKKKEIPEGVPYCPLIFPRTVCRREITREEASIYLRDHKTELLTDFISQRGRPFSAILLLRETGRHGFEFPPRGAKTENGEGASGPKRGRQKTPAAGKKKPAARRAKAIKRVEVAKVTKSSESSSKRSKKASSSRSKGAASGVKKPKKKTTRRARPSEAPAEGQEAINLP